jgi:hypothetical protein
LAEKAAVSETAVTHAVSRRRRFICVDRVRLCDRPGFLAVSADWPVSKGRRTPIKPV